MAVRILQIVTHMNRGGLETMLMNYYRYIDRNKIQFDFLVHRGKEADYDAEILSMGGKIYRLPPLNPLSPSYLRSLDNFFAEHKEYKIVHCHLDCMAGVPLKYAKKHGIQIRIAHAHSSNQTKDAKYLLKLIYQPSITKFANYFFACGTDAGKWMFRTNDFTVLKNAIDTERYRYSRETASRVRKNLGIAQDTFVVGHVGNFTPPKNHRFILCVFAKLLEKKPDAYLLLVGDGQLRRSSEEQAKELGIQNNVIFAGLRSDVNELLQAMDVFLFPSIYEGLPLSIVEAQAAGIPCLISDRVPIECKRTNLVQQMSLDEHMDIWRDAVLTNVHTPREDTLNEIKAAGFDIRENALWLQDFYLSAEENGGCLCQC